MTTSLPPVSTIRTFFNEYYLRCYPDIAKSSYGTHDGAASHYIFSGMNEGRSPNPFFVPLFYLKKYDDLKKAFGDNYTAAFNHWVTLGIKEGRQGSPFFEPQYYLNSNPDLLHAFGADGFEDACNHWINFGISEGRHSVSSIPSAVFEHNNELYLSQPGFIALKKPLISAGITPPTRVISIIPKKANK